MIMGLFDGLDVASAADNPFEVEPGTYDAVVTGAEARPTKNGDKIGLNLEYKIDMPGEPMHDRVVTEWKEIPKEGAPNADRAASFLKQRLANLGIPESRMNDVEESDLMGIECRVNVTKNGEYTNVRKVTLRETDTSGSSLFG